MSRPEGDYRGEAGVAVGVDGVWASGLFAQPLGCGLKLIDRSAEVPGLGKVEPQEPRVPWVDRAVEYLERTQPQVYADE